MAGYVKLFSSLLDSTVWELSPTDKVVWITLLAMADRDGVVEASLPGLAKRAGVELGDCERALGVFQLPDKYSRSKEHGGRRIEEVDGGWLLLNYEKYRDKASAEDKREKDAARQRRKYERDKPHAKPHAPHGPHETSPLNSGSGSSQAQSQKRGEADARARGTPRKGFQPTNGEPDKTADRPSASLAPVDGARRQLPEPEYVPPPPAFLEALAKIGRMPE